MMTIKKNGICVLILALVTCVTATGRQTLVLQNRAAEGDKEAMYNLAEGYYYGNSEVERDYEKAFAWYKKAAGKGYVPAIRDMGLCYLDGNGVRANNNKAWQCFEKAAKKGDAQSAYFMSQMYKEGLHGKKEESGKAYVRELMKAAKMGSEDALYEWGQLHYYGSKLYGIKQDKRGGVSLMLEAASKGNPDALLFAGRCYRDGTNGVRRDIGSAFANFHKAVELGNDSALCDLGICYIKGMGTDVDFREAYRCFEAAENSGQAEASRYIGDMYANGIDVKFNPEYAMQYYFKAEAGGDIKALLSQAMLMIHTNGLTDDPDRALRIFSNAAAAGDRKGYVGLGDCYKAGIAVTKSASDALQNYTKAFDQGNVHAAAQIGNMYYTGTDATQRNYEKAMKYFRVFLSDPMSVPRAVRGVTYRHIAECYRFGRGVAQDHLKAMEYTRKAYEDGQEELKALLDEL